MRLCKDIYNVRERRIGASDCFHNAGSEGKSEKGLKKIKKGQ